MNVVFFVVALSSLTWRYGVWGGGDVLLYKIIQAYVVEFLSMKKQLL